MQSPKRLSLGSGIAKQIPNAVTVDILPNTSAGVVHDLNRYPWPFNDNEFEEIYCFDILEHLEDVVRCMQEIHRISSDGAKILVTSPHFSSRNAFTDPTHKHFFGMHSFDYFLDNGHPDFSRWKFYTSVRFQKIRQRIYFERGLINNVIDRLVKYIPDFWERKFCWIFPAWYMELELRTIK